MRRSVSLGTKLNIALLLFLLLLGGATAGIMLYGFNRTQSSATDRSQKALEEQGKVALQAIVSDQANYDGLAIEAAAEMGYRAATFIETFKASGGQPVVDVSRFDTH